MNFVPYAPLLSLSMTLTADWVLLMMSCVPCYSDSQDGDNQMAEHTFEQLW